jgi:triacylglycerol lipase
VGYEAIYSRTDGIVHWQACLDPAAEHVEVRSSHLGMGLNRGVYEHIARVLDAPDALPRAA